MQLDQMAAVVRPRRSWEAIDLGFQMARAWWWPILRSWLVIVTPVFLLLTVALHAYPLLALFLFWWLKPLYDRIPLHVLSRSLFGSVPSVREVLSQMPRLCLARCLPALTLFRLDPMRSFLMPAGVLEGLAGAKLRERLAVLKNTSDDAHSSSWFTVACMVFEGGIQVALVAFLELMRPEEVGDSFWDVLMYLSEPNPPAWHYFLAMMLYFLSMTLIEPFYVAGGFALYLNRRTQLEGWDVEIAFRRLAERLEAGIPPARSSVARKPGLVTLLLLLALCVPPKISAWDRADDRSPARDPQEAIGEILDAPEFGGQRTVKSWNPRWDTDKDLEPERDFDGLMFLAEGIALVIRFFLWALLVVIVASVLWAAWQRFGHRLGRFRPPARRPAEDGGQVKIIAGLDISSTTLPDDIVRTALEKWRQGCPAEALSLLYRGALAWWVDRRELPARASWTEEDCLRHLTTISSPRVEYFSRLTSTWQRTAYAHRPPTEAEILELLDAWPRYFRSSGSAP